MQHRVGLAALSAYYLTAGSTEPAVPPADEMVLTGARTMGSLHCEVWAVRGECQANPTFMLQTCKEACGPATPRQPPPCVDKHEGDWCPKWAAAGECELNKAFMTTHCALSCGTCDMLDYSKRCPAPTNRTAAVPPGNMTATFQHALTMSELSPTLLSSDPWLISFDTFLRDSEIEALLGHGSGRYERSSALGSAGGNSVVSETSEIRTSWTTWCDTEQCLNDPQIQAVYDRVEDVSRVPRGNYEWMQVCKFPFIGVRSRAGHHREWFTNFAVKNCLLLKCRYFSNQTEYTLTVRVRARAVASIRSVP
jgi:hypothetical protein